MNPLEQLMALLQPRPTQMSAVRPDYGLTGAMVQAQAKSPYERTLRPGEQRTAADLQAMLGEVILAAGGGALPGVQGQSVSRRPPGMRAISATHPGDLTVKQLRQELRGGSMEWTPVPTGKPWIVRFPDGTALKGFETPETAMAWMSKNGIEF